jgi:hypothetical protein
MKLFCSIILFIFGFTLIQSEPSGDNICTKEVDKTFYVTKKITQNVKLVTTEACADVTQGFQCETKKDGTKVAYKTVPEVRKVNVTACCDGFTEINQLCIPSDQIGMSSNNKIGLGVIIMALSIIALAVIVFYYRKKYLKEKDPKLPTVSYKTQPTAAIPEPTSEFQNPLFSRPLTAHEKELEKYKIGGTNNSKVIDETEYESHQIPALDKLSPSQGNSSKKGLENPNIRESTMPLLENEEIRTSFLVEEKNEEEKYH